MAKTDGKSLIEMVCIEANGRFQKPNTRIRVSFGENFVEKKSVVRLRECMVDEAGHNLGWTGRAIVCTADTHEAAAEQALRAF